MIDLKELKNKAKDISILYVEDEVDIRDMMSKYLEKFFLRVNTAIDGEDGLNKFKQDSYDIVISDLSMPKMNGALMIQNIQSIKEKQLVIITSAHCVDDEIFDLSKINICGFINKPFEMQQLNAELYNAISNIK